jgi:S1-C subfamily serine protease
MKELGAFALIVLITLGVYGAIKWIDPNIDNVIVKIKAEKNVLAFQASGNRTICTAWVASHKDKSIIMTNAHCCNALTNNNLWYVLPEGTNKPLVAKVIYKDESVDACALRAKVGGGLELANIWYRLDEAAVYGHPFGYSLTPSFGHTLITTEIELAMPTHFLDTRYTMNIVTMEYTQLSLQVYPGNSGSPVMNSHGDVVGMISAGQAYTVFSFAVPLEKLRVFMDEAVRRY